MTTAVSTATRAEPGAAAPSDVLDFDIIFGDNGHGSVPKDLAWAPPAATSPTSTASHSERLAFFFTDDTGKGLWVFDVSAGRSRLLGRELEGDLTGKLDAFQWAPGGAALLIESDGDLLLFELDGEGFEQLTRTEQKEETPRFSPDGHRVAFVRDSDLYLLDLSDRSERRLTDDGRDNAVLNGKTDWVYWEEIWDRDSVGFWWSPGGDRIAYYRFDESPVSSYPLTDWSDGYPSVEWQKYPRAGTDLPLVRLGVLDLADSKTTWLETGEPRDNYLARALWAPDGGSIAVQRLNRDQDRLDLLSCSAVSGNCSVVKSERSSTWVTLHDDFAFTAGGRFLWSSEETGWNRLELVATDSPTSSGVGHRNLTPAGWNHVALDGWVAARNEVIVTAYPQSELGAIGRRVFKSSTTGREAIPISPADGWTTAAVSSSGYVALVTGSADRPAAARVLDPDSTEVARLPGRAPSGYDPEKLPSWRFFTLPGPDGIKLPAALLQPPGLDPAKKYPVVMYHYGGPASQVVADRWTTRGRNLWHKMMAQRGFLVLAVDNRGSNFFAKTGADLLHRRFGEVNLEAQLAAVRYLDSLGYADTDRIGLWGWSGGGANTLYSVLNSPGTWRAAVAGAPVTDWHFYDAIWTERYLDHPEKNPDGYRDSSSVTYAEKLEDALLMVHGTADDNVHPQNTFAMSAALIAAGKPFEQAIHPGQKHGFRGADGRHFYERMTEFFERHLAGPAAGTSH